jgi:hypothetical protein
MALPHQGRVGRDHAVQDPSLDAQDVVATGAPFHPVDRDRVERDVAVRVEGEAAQDPVLDPRGEELLENAGSRPVGARDRVEQHLGGLGRVRGEQIDAARLGGGELPQEADAGRG